MLRTMSNERVLKKDLFGEIRLREDVTGPVIVRDTGPAPAWVRPLARALLRREAAALAALGRMDGVPELLYLGDGRLERSYVDGRPMHVARPTDRRYFRDAGKLLRRLHRAGVCHNDLAKEPNLLVTRDGDPAFIDFQLAWHSRERSRLFRIAAREDIRHLLKHKRTYRPEDLSARERRILATPSPVSRAWSATVKPVYLFVTRRLLGWADREGAADRGRVD